MFESFRNNVDIPALLIFLGFLLIVGVPGLWYVKKTTGRSIRDMLALLGGAVILILLMMPAVVFFYQPANSQGRRTDRLAEDIVVMAYLPVALLVWWAFNKLAKRKAGRKRPDRATSDSTGKSDFPISR